MTNRTSSSESGHPNRYGKGCRCDACSEAHRLRMRDYTRRRRTEGRPLPRGGDTKYRIVCGFCGEAAEVFRRDGRFCSPSCAVRHRAGHSLSTDIVVWSPPPAAESGEAEVRSSGRLHVAGFCGWCDEPFTVLDQKSSRFCSRMCQRASSKARRRALERGALVEPVHRVRVFERDGWRCQICGRAVDRRAVVPHPKAPVLDHIVPLASGGMHEPKNVQCAHFLCNSRKGDRAAADQLLLFG